MTIIDKLHREPGMQLARMDDVAGCRLIFPTVKTMTEFRADFQRSRFKHRRKNDLDKYDYLAHPHPKNTGYRGIHDIYEYNVAEGAHAVFNGLLLELQYRTKAQHAWATAVEVITRVTENQPKFDRGDERYKEYFRLTSEIIVRSQEKMFSCYPALSNAELVRQYKALDAEIGLSALLRAVAVTDLSGLAGGNLILRFPEKGDLKVHRVPPGRSATDMYFDYERRYPLDDIVLVRAETFADIRSAYRNYFSDTRAFLNHVQTGCETLSRTEQREMLPV